MTEGMTLLRRLHAEAYPLMAGDVVGHEFHGNQWTNGIAGLNNSFPTSQKSYDAKPTPELESKIVSATKDAHEKIDSAVADFAASDKSPKEWEHFTSKVAQAKKEFESNSDSDTEFAARVEHSSGGNGRQLSESTYLTYEVSRKEDGESYFNTDTVRYSRHGIHARQALMAAGGDDVTRAIIRLQQQGKLPPSLTQGTVDAMKRSLRKYFDKISADKIDEFADAARKAVEATLKTEQEVRPGQAQTVTVGTSTNESRATLTQFLEEATGENIAEKFSMDFFQRIAREVAFGAGKFVRQNLNPETVDLFPALELVRDEEVQIPRGWKVVKGEEVLDEENGWPARWEAAGGELIDGRMVALKSSGIWQRLGDGVGGYTDTLGNPFAPFAFNSGMDTIDVSREEAVELGLMNELDKDGERTVAQGAELDFDELIALPTDAKMYAASVAHRALMAENKEDGVWRTIHGTPVFIKEGESVSDAFKEKFGDRSAEAKPKEVKKLTRDEAMDLFRNSNLTYNKAGEKLFNDAQPASLTYKDFREVIKNQDLAPGTTAYALKQFTSDLKYKAINENPNGYDSRRLLKALEKVEPYKGGSLHRGMNFSGPKEMNEFVGKLFNGEKTVELNRTLTSFSENESVVKTFANGNYTVHLEMVSHKSAREIGTLSSWKAANEKEVVLLSGSKIKYIGGTLEKGNGFAHYKIKVHEI